MIQDIKSPVALVTGSSAGIGKAIAVNLAREGFHVVVNGRRPEESIQELMSDLKEESGENGRHLYIQGDISQKETRQKIHDMLAEQYGSLSVLVNNAGVASKSRKDMLELEDEELTELLKINLIAPFMLSKLLFPLLRIGSEKSYLINISSISAYTVSTNRADYCISKAGVSMMTQLFAQRLVKENIRVFEIRPGIIRTDMTSPVVEKYDRLIQEGLLPIKRWGQPEDIAKTVLGIVKGYHPYATGEIINVDGGFHIQSL
jgi:3-oxoacyl-[acyl-carrier protein] reductase